MRNSATRKTIVPRYPMPSLCDAFFSLLDTVCLFLFHCSAVAPAVCFNARTVPAALSQTQMTQCYAKQHSNNALTRRVDRVQKSTIFCATLSFQRSKKAKPSVADGFQLLRYLTTRNTPTNKGWQQAKQDSLHCKNIKRISATIFRSDSSGCKK